MTTIHNKEQYEWAVKRVEQLLPLVDDNMDKSDPNMIELELLSNMVADYSEEHFSIGEPTLGDILKLRMEELGLSLTNTAKLIGVTPSKLQEYLSGTKEPTLRVGRNICKQLGVDADIVLGV